MSERYYISEQKELLAQGKAVLTGAESLHLTRVMRQKPGDEVLLFDGSGREFRGVIDAVGRDRVELTLIETREATACTGPELTMAVALPKGERQKWLVEKLTELGVHRYIPLRVERQDVKFDANVGKRLERQVIEASKQCGRLRLMEIGPEMSRREIVDWLPKEEQVDLLKILSHPISDGAFGQFSFAQFMERFTASGLFPRRILIAIGPVGGLTHAEVQEAVDDQWDTLDLGEQVYRVETAAIVAASLFLHMN